MDYTATSDRTVQTARSGGGPPGWLTGVALVVTALVFGYATNQVPSWEFLSAETMWINELAAPYAALAWLGGTVYQQSRVSAAAAGVAMVAIAFFGYYFEIIVETGSNPVMLLTFANPWLVLELFCGVVFGLLGRRWLLRREPWVAGSVALLAAMEAGAFASGLSGVDIPALNLYPPPTRGRPGTSPSGASKQPAGS